MQKIYRLTNTASFSYINRKGTRAFSKHLTVNYVPAHTVKAGIVVSKKVGKSVVRSKVKRRIKEAFRSLIPALTGKHNYVIIARDTAAGADFHDFLREIRGILIKAGHIA